jgi:hypothetical protein
MQHIELQAKAGPPAHEAFSRQAVTFDAVAGIYAPATVFSRSTSFFGPAIIGRHCRPPWR